MAKNYKVIPIKQFYWQVYRPDTLWGWLTVPLFKKVTVDFRYFIDEVETNIVGEPIKK